MIAAQSSSLNMDAKFKKTPIGEIPVEWEVSTIGQCAGVNLFTIPDNTPDNKKIRYIDISSIEKTGSISGIRDLFFRDAPSRARRKIEAGDILVSTVRPYLRAFAMVHDNGGDLIASTGFAVLSSTGVNGEFLYQFVLSEPFAQFLTERMTGSNYPAVNSSDVALCPIPLPPTQEQMKIADILSSVDDAIQKADAVIAKTRDLKKALMQRLLTRGLGHTKFKKSPIGEIPVEWEVSEIGNYLDVYSGFAFKSGQFITKTPSAIPLVKIGNLQSGQIKFGENTDYVDSQKYSELPEFRLNEGEILIALSGATTGKIAVAQKGLGQALVNQRVGIFRIKVATKIFQNFLPHLLNTDNFRSSVLEGLDKGAQENLSPSNIKKVMIPIPPLNEQTKIAEILSSVDDAIEKSESRRNRLDQTKKSLMADLLTGRVRTV